MHFSRYINLFSDCDFIVVLYPDCKASEYVGIEGEKNNEYQRISDDSFSGVT